jgi:glutathione synthase
MSAPLDRGYLFVMDPIDRINVDGDSTFVMMLEAERRGIPVWFATIQDLELQHGVPHAVARPAKMQRVAGAAAVLGAPEPRPLDGFAAIFMRKDPPVDVEFTLTNLVLDRVDRRRVVMINDPASLALANEKLFALQFPELVPESYVGRRIDRLRAFVEAKGEVMVKPLVASGGAGVIKVVKGDKNLRALLELLTQDGRVLVEAQAFLPNVVEGDRRVLLIDGEARGVINRRPLADDHRSNMHVGGRAEHAELTERDRAIAARLAPTLRRMGLVFVGLDVIDGWLTEINVTSPTGLQELARFTGVHLERELLDWVERRAAQLAAGGAP